MEQPQQLPVFADASPGNPVCGYPDPCPCIGKLLHKRWGTSPSWAMPSRFSEVPRWGFIGYVGMAYLFSKDSIGIWLALYDLAASLKKAKEAEEMRLALFG